METNHGFKSLVFYAFFAMCERELPAHHNGTIEEVLVPGRSFEEADRTARTVLGERYRGTTTVPVTQVDVNRA